MTAPPDAPRWQRLRRLLNQLLDLPPDEREAHLASVDPELAAEARALLAADVDEATARFERAVAERAAEALATTLVEDVDTIAQPASLAGLELGSFRLEHSLGRGGMAEVWAARRIGADFEQEVAIKLIKRGMDSEEIVHRFLRERQILARLDHPGIARFYDGGLAPDGRPYFVLEKVDGEPITTWCARRHADTGARLRLLLACADAVAAAHQKLVVHRDLKPSNVLVTASGDVKLLDFGIAKLLEDEAGGEVTRTEVRVLTPAYAAPEQIRGEPVSTATDVYSLGVLAYELLTGALPHQRRGRDAAELASAIDSEAIMRPSTALLETRSPAPGAEPATTGRDRRRRARELAGDLDTIVLPALRREPERRYPSVAAFAEDLRRFLAGRPIAARRDTVGYRLRKFAGRHRVAVATAAAALVALIALAAVALLQAARAESQARRAERVQRFLIEVFRQSEPGESLGETVTARQILEEGVGGIERQLADQPEVAADLYDALTEIYERLGLIDRASELAARALALREHRLRRDDRALARTLGRVASLRLNGEQAATAPALAEHAWRLMVDAAGGESLDAAQLEGGLADALIFNERVEEGVDHQLHVVEVLRRRLGADDPQTAHEEVELALALEAAGRYEESIAAFRRALPTLEQHRGARHPELARARRDLAGVLDRLGRSSEAEPLFRAALDAQLEVLGDAHPQTAETLFSYGIFLNTQSRYAEAEAAFDQAMVGFGRDNIGHAHCLRFLGVSYTEQGRYTEAVERLAQALEAYRRLAGEESAETWRAAASLGLALARQGNPAAGESALREAVAQLERLAGPTSYQVRAPLRYLGETLRRAGKIDEAIALLERTRELEIELFGGADHGDIAVTDLQLAQAQLASADAAVRAQAGATLDESITLFRRHKARSGGLGEALLLRADLRPAAERDAAAAELAEAATLLTAAFGADDPRARAATDRLAAP